MNDIEKRARELLEAHCPAGNYEHSDVLEAIIAALTPRWLSIDTAPKDSVTAFLGWDGDDMLVTYWCEWPRFRGWYKGEDQYETFLWEPTHWQPLPAPPGVGK